MLLPPRRVMTSARTTEKTFARAADLDIFYLTCNSESLLDRLQVDGVEEQANSRVKRPLECSHSVQCRSELKLAESGTRF